LYSPFSKPGNLVELAFAKTSGTGKRNWPIAEYRVPTNHPRSLCENLPYPVMDLSVVRTEVRRLNPHSQNPSDMGIPCDPNPNPKPNGEGDMRRGCPYHSHCERELLYACFFFPLFLPPILPPLKNLVLLKQLKSWTVTMSMIHLNFSYF